MDLDTSVRIASAFADPLAVVIRFAVWTLTGSLLWVTVVAWWALKK